MHFFGHLVLLRFAQKGLLCSAYYIMVNFYNYENINTRLFYCTFTEKNTSKWTPTIHRNSKNVVWDSIIQNLINLILKKKHSGESYIIWGGAGAGRKNINPSTLIIMPATWTCFLYVRRTYLILTVTLQGILLPILTNGKVKVTRDS